MTQNPRLTSLCITFATSVLIVLLMFMVKMGYHQTIANAMAKPFITLEEDEFVEVVPDNTTSAFGEEVAAAKLDEVSDVPSTLAPESGQHLTNSGDKGQTAKTVTTNRESSVQVKTSTQPEKAESAVDNVKKEQEATSKRTNSLVSSAFASPNAKGNSTNRDGGDGVAGKPTSQDGSTGAVSSNSTSVGVQGNIGGGWAFPNYNRNIPTSKTGSIIVEFVVHPDGSVSDVKVIGGQAPVGSDTQVQAAVIAEIKRHRLSRSGSTTADRDYTGRVTYTFK